MMDTIASTRYIEIRLYPLSIVLPVARAFFFIRHKDRHDHPYRELIGLWGTCGLPLLIFAVFYFRGKWVVYVAHCMEDDRLLTIFLY